ncbi:LacI family DNA-binding transcriptional regulator [Ruania alba]|uniref:DNA-binding transcriptional regulator, LacI/PurR family n=1 Tax=Ruania alba TaxID=648782 RepID=A0A1H5MTK0_9MICO|nr:LacI family DNA-binding transcriptional regulator [Ruania alba]SEE92654.1 DNA-binding transcriptional regulator, LacI/PurR family [Ruania alba]
MADQQRPPSIKDVAERAGVSWKTVSNVMNGQVNVRPETRQRVEQAIADLGYRRSAAGRQLRYGRSFIIALAVPELTTPYFADLAHEVLAAATERGYTTLITETGGDESRERAALRGFDTQVADGVILSPLSLDGPSVTGAQSRVPLVLLGERVTGSSLDHVIYDNHRAAREATTHVLTQGATRPLFLGASTDHQHGTGWLRAEGFLDALGDRGGPDLLVGTPQYTRAAGARAVDELHANGRPFDALVCASDVLAVGALHALRAARLEVPDQVQVIGWDGIDEGGYTHPTLSTVGLDVEAVARNAVDLVVARIEGSRSLPAEVVVEHRLVLRGSSR